MFVDGVPTIVDVGYVETLEPPLSTLYHRGRPAMCAMRSDRHRDLLVLTSQVCKSAQMAHVDRTGPTGDAMQLSY